LNPVPQQTVMEQMEDFSLSPLGIADQEKVALFLSLLERRLVLTMGALSM